MLLLTWVFIVLREEVIKINFDGKVIYWTKNKDK